MNDQYFAFLVSSQFSIPMVLNNMTVCWCEAVAIVKWATKAAIIKLFFSVIQNFMTGVSIVLKNARVFVYGAVKSFSSGFKKI